MLKFLKGRIQKRYLLDIWGRYRLEANKMDNTVRYFHRVKKEYKEMWKFRNQRYIYQLMVFHKFSPPKRLDPEFVKAKLLTFYYFNMSVHKLKKVFKRSARAMNTPIHYLLKRLDGRLMYILYKMGYESNLFIIEERMVYEKPIIVNNKECWNANHSIELGEWCYFKPELRARYKFYFKKQLEKKRIVQWFPKNYYFNLFYFIFFMYRTYRRTDFFYINNIDILKINELNNFLR